ncbi:MAG: hypothetical protein R3E96_04360 [Planctomycetota bacterium]
MRAALGGLAFLAALPLPRRELRRRREEEELAELGWEAAAEDTRPAPNSAARAFGAERSPPRLSDRSGPEELDWVMSRNVPSTWGGERFWSLRPGTGGPVDGRFGLPGPPHGEPVGLGPVGPVIGIPSAAPRTGRS